MKLPEKYKFSDRAGKAEVHLDSGSLGMEFFYEKTLPEFRIHPGSYEAGLGLVRDFLPVQECSRRQLQNCLARGLERPLLRRGHCRKR